MLYRILISIVLVLGLFVTPTAANAAEAPATEASADTEVPAHPKAELARPGALDVHKLKLARKRYWTGLALGLAAPAVIAVAFYGGAIAVWATAGEDPGVWVAFGALAIGGGAMAVIGSGLAISGAWQHASLLRRAGLDVSIGLSVAALVTPLAFYIGAFALQSSKVSGAGSVLILAGYVSTFAFSGAQLGVDGGKLAKSGISLSVAPTMIGSSPALALNGRW